MEACSASEWMQQFERLGLPIALLLIVFYFIYISVRWTAPRIDKWLTEHFKVAEMKALALEESSARCIQLQEAHLVAIQRLVTLVEHLDTTSTHQGSPRQ